MAPVFVRCQIEKEVSRENGGDSDVGVTGPGPCQTPGPGALSGLGLRLAGLGVRPGLSSPASMLSVCRFRAFVSVSFACVSTFRVAFASRNRPCHIIRAFRGVCFIDHSSTDVWHTGESVSRPL
jgi:hypothetical protein